MAARAATASRVENKLRKAAKQSEMRALRKGMKAGARPLCPRSGLLPHLPEEKPGKRAAENGHSQALPDRRRALTALAFLARKAPASEAERREAHAGVER